MLVLPIEKYKASSDKIEIKLFLKVIACLEVPEILFF